MLRFNHVLSYSTQEQPPIAILGPTFLHPSIVLPYCMVSPLSRSPDMYGTGISRLGEASQDIPEGNVEASFPSLFFNGYCQKK